MLAAQDRERATDHDDQEAEPTRGRAGCVAAGGLGLALIGRLGRGARALLGRGRGRTLTDAVVGLALGEHTDPGAGAGRVQPLEETEVDRGVATCLGDHGLAQGGLEADRVTGSLVGVRQGGQGVILAAGHGHADGVDADAAGHDLAGVLFHGIAATGFAVGDHQQLVAAGVHLVVAFVHEAVGRLLHGLTQGSAAVGADRIHRTGEAVDVHGTQVVGPTDVATVEDHETHMGVRGDLGDHALERALGHEHLLGLAPGVVRVGHVLVHGAGGVQDDHDAVVDVVRGQGHGRHQDEERQQAGEEVLHDRLLLPVEAGVLDLDLHADDGELHAPVVRHLLIGARQHDHGLADSHTLHHELVGVDGEALALGVGQVGVLGHAAPILGEGQGSVGDLARVLALGEGVEPRIVEHLADDLGVLDVQGLAVVEVRVVALRTVAADLPALHTGVEHGTHGHERIRVAADRQGRGGVGLGQLEHPVELRGVLGRVEAGLVGREAGGEGQGGVVTDGAVLRHALELAARTLGVERGLALHALGLQAAEHGVIPVDVRDLDVEVAAREPHGLGHGVGTLHEGSESVRVGPIHEVQVSGVPYEGRVAVQTVGVLEGGVGVVVVHGVLHEGHVLVRAGAVVRVHQVLDLLGRVQVRGHEVAEILGVLLRPVGAHEVRVRDGAAAIGRAGEHVCADHGALGTVAGLVRTAGEGVHVRSDDEGAGDVLVALEGLDR